MLHTHSFQNFVGIQLFIIFIFVNILIHKNIFKSFFLFLLVLLYFNTV